MVNEVNWEVKHKNEHFAKCAEIRKICEFAEAHVNQILFDPDFVLDKYQRMAYNFKNYKKSELGQELRTVRRYICNELDGILQLVRTGEVDWSE